MDLKAVLLLFVFSSLLVGGQGKALNTENDSGSDAVDGEDFSDGLSEDKIDNENNDYDDDNDDYDDETSDAVDSEDFSDGLTEEKMDNENDDYDDDNNDDDYDETSDYDDSEGFSDDLSEDKIDNENNDDDDDYEHNDNDDDDTSDDFSNKETAADEIYKTNKKSHVINDTFEEDIKFENKSDDPRQMNKRAAKKIGNTDPRWPNKIVYYSIESNSVITSSRSQPFRDAIAEIEGKTCIRFRNKAQFPSSTNHYISIFSGDGCWSYVGRAWLSRGYQRLSIKNNGCNYKGVIIHELMHALGFWHEQSRNDRDNYITVLEQNIIPAFKSNFMKHPGNAIQDLKENYDYNSVMHYGNTAFTRNGQPTIVAKDNPNRKLGQRNGMSESDVRELNKYYECQTQPGTPQPSQGPQGPILDTCNFDNTLCGWTNGGTSRKFTLRTGRTPSYRTGPSTDHSGSGSYIYFETSWPVRGGEKAEIISKRLQATSACVTFWYNMYGGAMGTLQLGIQNQAPLWSKSGNQGTQWKEDKVTVRSTTPFQIVFTGTRGRSYTSDIALDDIVITQGSCDNQATSAPPTPPPPRKTLKCDFEKNNCDFTHTGTTVKFVRTKLTSDNNPGTVSFLSATRLSKENDPGSILSPLFEPTKSSCLSFSYMLSGDTVGDLAVYLANANGEDKKQLMDFFGNHGNHWYEYQVEFASPANYKILFVGKRGQDLSGRIALDDISVALGSCKKSVCGIIVYDPSKETCCCGNIYTTQSLHQCCGSEYYPTNLYKCCDTGGNLGRLVSKNAICG